MITILLYLKGCHWEEDVNLFSLVSDSKTRINGQKVYRERTECKKEDCPKCETC